MSAILSADDLNDFISPGVACIKPVETLPPQEAYNPYEVTTEDKVQTQTAAPASISLTDCLACSGCVTSAEAVLISLQSHNEVLHVLDTYPSLDISDALARRNNTVLTHASSPSPDAKLFVASVSPQVRASLAAMYGIAEKRAGFMVEQFLSGAQGLRIGGQYHSGFTYVVDTNRLREACLVLGAEEVAESLRTKSKPRPILTSACPGWICYAEKTHPHVLPHLSALKSPQAMSGTLLKSVLSTNLGIDPSQIWHLAIMPCFDKKLEASREELTNQWWQSLRGSDQVVRDVDCVITPRELLSLADARNISLPQLALESGAGLDRTPFPDPVMADFLFSRPRRRTAQSPNAGSSGGYLYHILATEQALHPGSTIFIQRGRNADVIEYTLHSPSGETLMKSARYYGFRNIQNLVRKLKPAKQSKLPGASRRTPASSGMGSDYAYIEVMACPGGCTNGGGQIKLEDVSRQVDDNGTKEAVQLEGPGQKEWLKRVDEAYYSADSKGESEMELDTQPKNTSSGERVNGDPMCAVGGPFAIEDGIGIVNGINVPGIHDVLAHWSSQVGVSLSKLAYTTFRQVESDVGKISSKDKGMDDAKQIAQIASLSGGGW